MKYIKRYTAEELKQKIVDYFKDEKNVPYSRYDLCSYLQITGDEYNQYMRSKESVLSELIRLADTKIIAAIEKGDRSPTLATFLLKNMTDYIGENEQKQESDPVEVVIKVEK